MTSNDNHQKHPSIARPSIGFYHRCEWAIYGSTCNAVNRLYKDIDKALSRRYRFVYIDADHDVEVQDAIHRTGKKMAYMSTCPEVNEYDDKMSYSHVDAAFINGNHYSASRQIVVIDPDKEASLLKRIDQLTNIDLVLLKDPEIEPFDFLKEHIKDNTPILMLDDLDGISKHIGSKISSARPVLKAVVLAGGQSKRMQTDKADIAYHGDTSHPQYLADICKKLGLKTYISKQHDYPSAAINDYPVIKDRMVEMGPFGAILSAFMMDPDAAWLVLACDLPFVNKDSIDLLIRKRDVSKIATAFQGKGKPFPEPLIAIYEPSAYGRFLQFLSLGYACPRKVLINSDTRLVHVEDDIISNVNYPEERDRAIEEIKGVK